MTDPVPTPFDDLAAGAFGRRKQPKQASPLPVAGSSGAKATRIKPVRSPSSVSPSSTQPASPSSRDDEERDRSYLKLSADERLELVDKVFVYDDQAYDTVMELERLRTTRRATGNLMIMSGPTGSGKTVLTTRYAAQFEAKRTPSFDTLPVARAELFGQTDGPNFLQALHKSLEHPSVVKLSYPHEGLRVLGAWAKTRQTEMIVVDAAEQLCRAGRLPDEIVNLISAILDRRLVGTLVLSGDEVLQTAVKANPRLLTQVRSSHTLADLDFEDDAGAELRRKRGLPVQRDAAMAFLSDLAWDLPFDLNGLDNEMMVERFHVAVNGNRRAIMNLVYDAAQAALKHDPKAKVFGSEHLAVAFGHFYPDRLNPFLTDLPPRKGVSVRILEDLRKKAEDLARLNR